MADLSSLLGAAGIGGAIGKAIVSLELETTKYQGELKAMQAETVASTNNQASAFSKFGSLASSALLGVGVAAVAGAALSIKAAVEANDAHLKLQNTFANNASLADSSVAAFEAQADALRDLTGVDDEAIISGQALLGQFDLTGAQVMELTPLIVDLSEKMDIDLQAAAKAVGKATAGSSGILSRYGIVLDQTKLSADAFGTTLEGLSVVQGFAADSAKNEPWRVLGAQFEEIAEQIGQALLPVLQNLVPTLISLVEVLGPVLDLVGKAAPAIKFLGEAFVIFLSPLGKAVSLLGDLRDAADLGIEPTSEMTALIEQQAHALQDGQAWVRRYSDELGIAGDEAKDTGEAVAKFAHMTGKDLKEWSDKTKESFESYVINLDKVNEATDFTRKDLRDSFRAMLEHARDLNQAMRTLSREHWINDDFIAFLAEQPEKLILFADSNETQQRRMQTQWEKSGDILKNQVNDRLDVMTGALDKLDKSETKHKIIFEYSYEGFDPSKPGMSDRTGRGGPQ